MREWLIAIAAGLVLAALSYVGRHRTGAAVRTLLGALRAVAIVVLTALALDAPAGRSRELAPLVALDVSSSWTRGGDSLAFRHALDSARAAGADTLWLVGDSLRPARGAIRASDAASRVSALVDRATASGRRALLLTDGEIDDASSLRALARGSRVASVAPRRGLDVAALSIEAPRLGAATDTVDVRVALAADAAGAPAGTLGIDVGGKSRAQVPFTALPPFGERTLTARVPLEGSSGPAVLRAVVASPGDREPRNDTVAVTVDVTSAPAAVFITSAPDYDSRAMLGVVRGALSLPTRAYLRVAPGQWRVEGSLAPVAESDVRAAAASAGVLVLHGDTSVFGQPRALGGGRGALLLFAVGNATPPNADGGEWYASDAPPSPLAAALSGAAWDSLPPLDAGATTPSGDWEALRARLGRSGAPRAVIAGRESPRRVLVVGATGFWRWQFRGGAAADAFNGLWGGALDFLAAGRGDVRAAVAADALVRAGEPVRWRRGGADSVVTAVVTRRGVANARSDTLQLHFPRGNDPVSTPPLAAGVYDVRVPGGNAVLVVNAARELLPRRPTVAAGPVGTGAPTDATPRLRQYGWLFLLALALLCAEWLLRRRVGLR